MVTDSHINVKKHYDEHLGEFYSWMIGDFNTKQTEQQAYFTANEIAPLTNGVALDLGAGHGLQSVSLAKLGFKVTAVDFSKQLLDELRTNCTDLHVTAVEDDIRNVTNYRSIQPELIICAGDTISHLADKTEVEQFIADCSDILCEGGLLILTFRDYTNALESENRFIPVKSDQNRILTCFLEFVDDKVIVTDLLHYKSGESWQQQVSSYKKVRITESMISAFVKQSDLDIISFEVTNRLITIIAQK